MYIPKVLTKRTMLECCNAFYNLHFPMFDINFNNSGNFVSFNVNSMSCNLKNLTNAYSQKILRSFYNHIDFLGTLLQKTYMKTHPQQKEAE
jgi:hypothetical protein